MSVASALQGAVAECAATAERCEEASPDAGASCRDQFESCRDTAKQAAKPDIDKAVNPCIDAFKGCRDAAQTDAAKEQCATSLHSCLGAGDGDHDGGGHEPSKPDAGGPKESTSPVVDCIEALHTCIAGDSEARVCTDDLRECIAGSVGHNGNQDPGKPDDAGKPDHAGEDGGKPDEPGNPDQPMKDDAGKPVDPGHSADAGMPVDPGHDASAPDVDAGREGDSKACKDAREACLGSGGEREACARMLKECR
jgi:hypothetical protein